MADENWAEQPDKQEVLSEEVEALSIKKELEREDTRSQKPENLDKNDENYENPLTQVERSLLKKMLRDKLVQSNQELQVQQRDPTSPLYSVKTFEELSLRPELLQGIYAMGFNRPSKIQETALPLLLRNPPKNMIAQSQSGTGKTATFVLTMLTRIRSDLLFPQCLCLSPTYELALQTGKVVEEMGKFLPNLKVAYAVKGNRVSPSTKIDAQIVVGTPGTVIDWIRKHTFDMNNIVVFVLDEADVMIATKGFRDQSIRIHRQCPRHCQFLLFSSTYNEPAMKSALQIVHHPNILKLRRDEETLTNIKQYYVKCLNMDKKYEALTNLYGNQSVDQAVIFCHTHKIASWLAKKMCDEKFIVALLAGKLDVSQRASILQRFKNTTERVLVTTDGCLRGIHFEQVILVVNFDLPVDLSGKADCETYLHQIDRTGRFGKSGVAINFVSNERDMRVLQEIERHFGIQIKRLDTGDCVDMEKKLGDN